ncbi:MAG: DNA/RNA non-specific endonuclease [Myxococcaceae bacterium]
MRTNELKPGASPKAIDHSGLIHSPGIGKVAVTTPAAIGALETKMGWASGSWQDKLLQAADQSGNKDGKVTRAELDTYLSSSPDLQFLTSTQLQKMSADAAKSNKVAGFTGWQGKVAQAADVNHDGQLSQDELNTFTAGVKAGTGKTGWMADQKAAALLSAVASQTNEADALNSSGLKGNSLQRDYMHITEDETRHDPAIVSYVLTPQDIAENTNPQRANNFHTDKGDKGSSTPADYASSGFDQGHQRAAEDSVDDTAMNESFLMTNMAPQTPELNRMSWRVIETGVRQLVQATGAKATVNTGSLFVDANGKPLPDAQIQKIGKDGVAVPTYSFKTVLLEYPDGHKQAMAFVMPNRKDLPVKGDASMRQLIRGSMMPVSKLENMIAAQQGTAPGSVKLYPELTGSDVALKNAPPPDQMRIPNWKSYSFANFIWPQPDSVTQVGKMQDQISGDGGPTLDLGTLAHPK